jgi:hypothetical protein
VFHYKKSLCSKVHFNVPKRKYMLYKILFKYKYICTVDGQIKLGQKKKQSQVKIYKFASFNYGFITNRLTLV